MAAGWLAGWLAAAYIIGADGWRERGTPGKDDGGEERTADGEFFMCGRLERERERERERVERVALCTSVMQRRD